MTFTVEKMYILPDAGHLKAFCDVALDDCIVIKGIRVLNGKKGLFISLPQEQGKDNKWYDQVVCKRADVYDQLSSTVQDHYKRETAPPQGWSTNVEGVAL